MTHSWRRKLAPYAPRPNEGASQKRQLEPRSRPGTGLRAGGGRTRTYEGIASGFTVRPLCRSGHSPAEAAPKHAARTLVAALIGKPASRANPKHGVRDAVAPGVPAA